MGSRERLEREKAEHRKKREELILFEAEQLFLAKGFIASTISEIAAACELTNGAIYLYYKNKDQLIMKVMSRISLHFAELLEEAANSAEGLSGLESVSQVLGVYNMTFKKYTSFHLLDAQFNIIFSQSYPQGELINEYFSANRRVLEVLTSVIDKGIIDGSIFTETTAERTAGLLLNAVNSYVEKISLRGELMEHEQGISMGDELNSFLELLLRGLSAPQD